MSDYLSCPHCGADVTDDVMFGFVPAFPHEEFADMTDCGACGLPLVARFQFDVHVEAMRPLTRKRYESDKAISSAASGERGTP